MPFRQLTALSDALRSAAANALTSSSVHSRYRFVRFIVLRSIVHPAWIFMLRSFLFIAMEPERGVEPRSADYESAARRCAIPACPGAGPGFHDRRFSKPVHSASLPTVHISPPCMTVCCFSYLMRQAGTRPGWRDGDGPRLYLWKGDQQGVTNACGGPAGIRTRNQLLMRQQL